MGCRMRVTGGFQLARALPVQILLADPRNAQHGPDWSGFIGVYCAVQEKDQMLKWVEEEVDRVKGMFEEKERRLTADAQAALRDCEAAKAAQQTSAAAQQEAENQLGTVAEQLQVLSVLPMCLPVL